MDYRNTRNRKGQTGLQYGESYPSTYARSQYSKEQKCEKQYNFTALLLVQTIAVATILSVFTAIQLISADLHKDISAGMDGAAFAGEYLGKATQDVIQYVQESETFSQLFPADNDLSQGDSARWTSVFLAEVMIEPAVSDSCTCPIDYTKITSFFGLRNDPFSNAQTMHNGWDMAAEEGTAVRAAWGGIVADCDYDKIGGNFIVIDHGNQTSTYYGHLSNIHVQEGQFVDAGQTIGLSGNTGKTTGPHLHFEIAQNGESVDPAQFLNA